MCAPYWGTPQKYLTAKQGGFFLLFLADNKNNPKGNYWTMRIATVTTDPSEKAWQPPLHFKERGCYLQSPEDETSALLPQTRTVGIRDREATPRGSSVVLEARAQIQRDYSWASDPRGYSACWSLHGLTSLHLWFCFFTFHSFWRECLFCNSASLVFLKSNNLCGFICKNLGRTLASWDFMMS